MKPGDDEEEVLFREACRRPKGAARETYLDQACGGNQALRDRLATLLEAYENPDPFLEPLAVPPGSATGHVDAEEGPGTLIGRYKILEKIGEGGFGVVYVAEQQEPVKRRVALKIIKLGMDTKEIVARFESERQALAMMDHPNIARVFDGGATETGRPYFVMELVRGVRLTDYCDQSQLPTEERLKLFVQVCHAIQHAHQKGVIHRDIKPSNVMVMLADDVAVPKVIDFGIAKAIGERLTDKTVYTRFEQFIGTPAYTSPEQAGLSGLDVDTRSDIYGLGVLLYELLTGQTPFEPKQLAQAGLDEIRRCIQEDEPPKPSTRLSRLERQEQTTTAQRRATEAPKLIRLLRGDLDWIVMKCLEKNRARRYQAANDLARDIECHLNHQPTLARPPSRVYRAQKFVRRHKVMVGAVAVVAMVLVLGILVSTWQAVRAVRAEKREREKTRIAETERQRANGAAREAEAARRKAEANESRAQTEAAKSQQVAKFLEDMLAGVGPSVALGRDTKMLQEILDRTSEQVGKDLTNQPEVEAELRCIMGRVYDELGDYPKADGMYRETLRVGGGLSGGTNRFVATSFYGLGRVLHEQRRWPEAESMKRQALAMQRILLGKQHADVARSLTSLADTVKFLGKLAEAEALSREALEIWGALGRHEDADVATALNDLGAVLWREGKLVEAEQVQREALGIWRKVTGNESPSLATALQRLASVLSQQGKWAEAEAVQREALQMRKKLLGQDHPLVGASLYSLGTLLQMQGKLAEAEAAHREEILVRQKGGIERSEAIGARYELMAVLREEGKLDQAEAVYREAMTAQTKLLALRTGPDRYSVLDDLASYYEQLKLADAEALLGEGLRLNRELCPTNRLDQRSYWALFLGDTLRKEGKLAEAEPLFREAVTNAAKSWANDFANWRWHVCSLSLIDILHRLGTQDDSYRVISDILTPELPGASRDTALLEVRAYLAGRGAKWKEATADYARLIENAPNDQWLSDALAPLLLITGDLEGYRQLCGRILARAGLATEPDVCHQMALDCLLLPPTGADLPTIGRLADRGVASACVNQVLPGCQLTKALAEYRQGHFADATKWVHRALVVAGEETREREAGAYAVLAMIEHRMKHAEEARAALSKAAEITQTKLPQLDGGDLGRLWHDLLVAHILLREAKALIEGESVAAKRPNI